MFERVAIRLTAKFSGTTMETRHSKMMSANTEFYTQQKISFKKGDAIRQLFQTGFRQWKQKMCYHQTLTKKCNLGMRKEIFDRRSEM